MSSHTISTFKIVAVAVMFVGAVNGSDSTEKIAASVDNTPAHVAPDEESPRDPNRLWCNEHEVYEDECFICHPELKPNSEEETSHTSTAAEPAMLMCNEHDVPEAECGICRPEALSALSVGEGLKVRFSSSASTTKAGVTVDAPAATVTNGTQELLGQVSFNRNQLANVTPLAAGVVLEVLKDVGDMVQAGEVLAAVQCPEIAQAKSEYLKALAEKQLAGQTLSREEDLYKRGISARQDLEAAQAAHSVSQSAIRELRQRLLNFGLTQDEIDGVQREGATTSVMPVRAPLAGTIIDRDVARGAAIEPGAALFQVADLSTMWMQLSAPENQLAVLQVGSPISARLDAYPGVSFDGEIQWISPTVDAQTRMLNVRAVLANPQGLLKDGLFGRATLAQFSDLTGVTIPSSSIQDVDGRPIVFRKLEDDLFEVRLVEIGAAKNGRIVVLAGLALEDRIVTNGSYIMKSELLKARLGAGCADH